MKRINLVSPSKYDSIMCFVKVKLTLFSNNQMVLSNAVVNMCLSTVIPKSKDICNCRTTSCGNGKVGFSILQEFLLRICRRQLYDRYCVIDSLFFGNDFDAARQIALDLQLKSI
jgi:hypothetical protein